MADSTLHAQQSESNKNAASYVRKDFPDWAVTICFYAALHLIESYAANNGDDINRYGVPSDPPHTKRQAYVGQISNRIRNRELRKAYDKLYDGSLMSRYMKDLDQSAVAYYQFAKNKVDGAFKDLAVVKAALS
ncbi:MAG: hypothetical protein AAGB13_01700 [Cyanobacteria bacterium P01_F01_bin.33]